MYKNYNCNSAGKYVGDCTVRALSMALDKPWETVYTSLCAKGYDMCDMPDSNAVWGAFLQDCGYNRHIIPDYYSPCYTISDFAAEHQNGTYIVGTGTHVVCVRDGDIYDTWDCSHKIPIFYFVKG